MYLKVAGISIDIYYLQKISRDCYSLQGSFKMSFVWKNFPRYQFFCKNHARCLLFSRIMQDIYFLHKHCKTFISWKHLVRYTFFARISQDIYCLQESCRLCIICKSFARFLLFARISQNISFFAPDFWYLQQFFKVSNICRKVAKKSITCESLARYLIFAGNVQNVSSLQEPCKISIVCQNPSGHLLFAKISQGA